MKKPINRNYLWSKFFVDQLEKLGVKYVCISPGSRNTPLTTAFSQSKKIKQFVIVDERSSAFFALGLAKQTGKPAAVVTTSGTATVNLYPAIVEAYQSRIPLLICTADRPDYLRNTGSNQTINQDNLYSNHIRLFYDTGLPRLTKKHFAAFHKKICQAYFISKEISRGPVHLNFPFEKPLEESITTDELSTELLKTINFLQSKPVKGTIPKVHTEQEVKILTKKINQSRKGIIFIGWGNYPSNFLKATLGLAKKCKYPVLIDAASGYNYGTHGKNILCNHNVFLRSEKFLEDYSPEIIIQFGNPPVSNPMLDFFEKAKAYKVLINENGDRLDPSRSFDRIIKADPEKFCLSLSPGITARKQNDYLTSFQKAEEIIEGLKNKEIAGKGMKIESSVIMDALKSLPDDSNLFISNSMPMRDADYFKSQFSSKTNVYVNRGASGIDGINSTAAGIAAASGKPTLLITGDLSFFHDTNGMHILKKYSIPLAVLLVNNGGGGIFGMLPIAKEKEKFDEYFLTPLNLDFPKIITGFGGTHKLVKNFAILRKELSSAFNGKTFTVLEVKTDYQKSIHLRKDYFRKAQSILDNEFSR